MEFLKALAAVMLFAVFLGLVQAHTGIVISGDATMTCLAIVAAGALAHSDK